MTFQEMASALQRFWARQGCALLYPYDLEKGAGTFHPATFFGALGSGPCAIAYVEPCRRPTDGRYAENPNRLSRYYQYQVILKPPPDAIQQIYLRSLRALGIHPRHHDIRFVEDDWESPSLGAAGLGWEVWLDGMEITQFTYFQQMAGMDLEPISVELTYGLERLALYIQKKNNVFDLQWDENRTYGDLHREGERQFCFYYFDEAPVAILQKEFQDWESQAGDLLEKRLYLPAYDGVMKCSHFFNLLDARGALSVTERTDRLSRIRRLARMCAHAHLEGQKAGEAAG